VYPAQTAGSPYAATERRSGPGAAAAIVEP
jgi:hypothetical protein